MLKKSVFFAAALSCMMTFAFTGAAMAAGNGPETITLQTAAAKKPAVFPHKKHQDMGIKCAQCHHIAGADGKQAPLPEGQAPAKCETCHNDKMANAKLNSFMLIGHERCKGCHKAGFNGKNGPTTKCDGCHPKK
ncbi:MAG: hypothetical protein AUK28_07055 [Desulfobacterales bacterium CG2_30_60_27]|nr:MAG: hypothetical protein AUK28_07055 [Desulfobacterales bacterium CG2_30_60_27]